MQDPDYDYTLERLDKIEYVLATETGNIKERLVLALTLNWITVEELPTHLQPLHNEINKVILSIPGDDEESTFKKSLKGKYLITCKGIAVAIIDLKFQLGDYIKSLEE